MLRIVQESIILQDIIIISLLLTIGCFKCKFACPVWPRKVASMTIFCTKSRI